MLVTLTVLVLVLVPVLVLVLLLLLLPAGVLFGRGVLLVVLVYSSVFFGYRLCSKCKVPGLTVRQPYKALDTIQRAGFT